jgi:spore maturation protein CgeB
MGHSVQGIDQDPLFAFGGFHFRGVSTLLLRTRQAQEYLDRLIFQRLAKFQPELIINTYADFLPETVERIKIELRAKVVYWFTDSMKNFGREYALAADYDALFFVDPYIVDFVRLKLGRNVYHLPEACNPRWHKRIVLTPEEMKKYGCDLTTAGNMYYYRALLLEPFKDYDLKIWGASYPSWLKSPLRKVYPNIFVPELEKAKAFNAAKIVVNTIHYSCITGVNCRTFEIAGCGAFQIADYRPGMVELFEPEKEVVLFDSREELKSKVDYYLSHPEQRQKIADAGYARAHRDHTFEVRIQRIFDVVHHLERKMVAVPNF